MQHSISYRRDIDGLRALAVLSVIFYHYGVPGFGGGFCGVDIFFVISGFLIGGHIVDEVAAGCFSLPAFYERRIRRILPALFCMLGLVLLAAPAILFAPDFHRLVPIAFSVVAFLANVQIDAVLYSYNGQFVRNSPLAHTWSLAVEEQFYLLFPLLMLAIARLAGRRYVMVLAPLALLSFLACVAAARIIPIADFYLLPFRAWELLMGALLALGPFVLLRDTGLRPALALLGLVLIAAANLFLTPATPFPSEYALLPCGGAALLILAACDRRQLAGRLLDNPAMARVGLWSYSLYLVHWPLLVFARDYFYWPLSLGMRVFLLAATFVLGALSWRYVEQPFRGPGKLFSRGQIYALAVTAALVLVGETLVLRGAFDAPDRFFPEMTRAQAVCWDVPPAQAARTALCRVGAAVPARTVVWGDSHVRAVIPGVAAAFAAHDDAAIIFAQGGCPPLLDIEMIRHRPMGLFASLEGRLGYPRKHCSRHNDEVLHWIAGHGITTVILAAHWLTYADTGKVPTAVAAHLMLFDSRRPDTAAGTAAFTPHLAMTLAALQSLHLRVFLVEDVPQNAMNVPFAQAAAARFGREEPRGLSRGAYDEQQVTVRRIFERLQKTYGFGILRPQDVLCATGTCALSLKGQSLYQDEEHVTPAGALLVAPAFDPVWR